MKTRKPTKRMQTALIVIEGLLLLTILATMLYLTFNLVFASLTEVVATNPEILEELEADNPDPAAEPESAFPEGEALPAPETVRTAQAGTEPAETEPAAAEAADPEPAEGEAGIPGPNPAQIRPLAIVMYAALALLFLLKASFSEDEWKWNWLRYGAGALLFAAAAVTFAVVELVTANFMAAGFHAVALMVDHVFSIIKDHRARNIVIRVLFMLILVLGARFLRVSGAFVLAFTLMLTAPRIFFYIFEIAFSRIKLSILRKILLKTYAAEILFGLLLLMVAFSIVLPSVEFEIGDFWDALWYCFAIVTTIGFGDYTAVSIPGRIISVILGIYGLIVVALLTSIIVNFYNEMRQAEAEEAIKPAWPKEPTDPEKQ